MIKNIKKYQHEWYLKHKKEKQVYYKTNKTRILKAHKLHYLKNKKRINKKWRKYYQQNKNYILKISAKYRKNRLKCDLPFHLLTNIRARINRAIRKNTKSQHTQELLGCSIKELKQYLQSKFKKGMTWKNYGCGFGNKGMKEWHIDHIKKCSSFNLSIPKEQIKCFHYTNLQPLWATENRLKH